MSTPVPGPPDALRAALETALGAQYTVVGLLGRGGMGAVYLARERLLERLVAIKVLPSERSDDESRERFLREARTAAQLSHPNIVPLLSFGEMGEMLFYIMRYVDGESLEARLRRDGRLPAHDARRILAEIADALGEAHRLGIVHRDIKPDNVMLEKGTGRAMLTDFGIARQLGGAQTLTGTGLILGSPQYMSPEQASGDRSVDARSDIYSLGILGYRMLSGRLPFEGQSVRELLARQITDTPVAIATYAPDTPLDLADALMRCLEKDPDRRWNDARSFHFAAAAQGGDAFEVPEQIEDLPRIGTRVLNWLYALEVGLVALYAYTDDPEWVKLAIGGPIGGLALPLLAYIVRGRRFGISWQQVLRMAFWPGQRSFVWWPKALRPTSDVWERLPESVRRARVWNTAALGVIGGVAVPLMLAGWIAGSANAAIRAVLFQSASVSMVAAMLPLLGAAFAIERWKKRWSLTALESRKLLEEPTHGSRFWARPSIAALLRGETEPAAGLATSVDGMVQALVDLASQLPNIATSMAREASTVAKDLARELRGIDERIGDMSKQSDPAEEARLRQRIAALGPDSDDQTDGVRQMRALLVGQVALFAQFEARRHELEARRDVLHDLLRTLWLQVMNYRAQVAHEGDASELSERIRELCQSIERRADAADEVERVLER
jgi:predicted Ser/Thr protein kinase